MRSHAAMMARVQGCVAGYRLKRDVQFELIRPVEPLNVPGLGARHALKTSVFLEVEGAAHYLPMYAVNLDIMASAALACAATRWASHAVNRRHCNDATNRLYISDVIPRLR